MANIAQGHYSDPEIAAFVTVYLMRNITIQELAGFRDALLELRIPVDLSEFDPIDVCGTGGDEKDTFNISTATAFVVAGAGIHVAKHGNNSVSSTCGSSNVLNYFGYEFTNDEDKLKSDLERAGICFLHAPLFNPAMKNVAPVRKQLKLKTFFNMLGPMVNPAIPKKQMVGVFSLGLARLYNYIYENTDTTYTILYSLDGYDEVSLTSDIKIYGNKKELIQSPQQLGFQAYEQKDLYGGSSIDEAGNIFLNVLEGKASNAQLDVVIANAGMAINTYYPDMSSEDSMAMARESIASKRALDTFKKLINQ